MTVTATLSLRDVRGALRRWVGKRTLTAAARELGVTNAYLSMVLSGHRLPGEKIRDVLGVTYSKRTVHVYTYERIGPPKETA